MTLLSPPAIKAAFPKAAARRLKAWSGMTSKQKLADMEKEDRRRKKKLRAYPELGLAGAVYQVPRMLRAGRMRNPVPNRSGSSWAQAAAAQPLYHEKP
jgi:hypothetical protein